MKKELRIRVYNKYGKRCAYCGNEIEYKDMQVDHLLSKAQWNTHPKVLNYYYDGNGITIGITNIDDFKNLMPSCRRCNHYKRAETLSQFRNYINTLHQRIRNNYIVKVAIDYELIEFKKFDGMFYFEKLDK
ncbi:unnamed protein product [marine sediment metagenome]|uniref:HNH nuclease domain-containing protein n=1 Tax=marine sediment metagenome TaxID=412755 RepID=X1BIH2_9ZZZZ